jgi:magnesium transporter
MVGNLLRPEIHELIAKGNYGELRDIFREWPPADLAELITDLPEEERVLMFRILPHDIATAAFEYFDIETQQNLLRAMGHEETVKLINGMSPDDRTALLEELPSSAVTQLLRLLTPEERAVAQQLLGYPQESVGRLMTPDFIAVQDDWTVKEVLDFVREHGQDSETLNVIYVVDDRGKLIDDVRIREFLLRPLDRKVRDIRDETFVALRATSDQEEAVNMFRKYDRNTLPVVDSHGTLVGIVTIDDVLDVAEEEATEDIQKLGGMEAFEEPYMVLSLPRVVQKRVGWLTLLFFGQLFTASAMGLFEAEIEKAAVLAIFVPLIISSGGNCGSQAATLMVRSLALGELRLGDWWRVIGRELATGICLGLVLGALGFLCIGIWESFGSAYGQNWLFLALTIGLSLLGIVLWGTLCGALLPFLLKRLNFDPAAASAPLVATFVDVTGLLIYFGIAVVLLRGTLL